MKTNHGPIVAKSGSDYREYPAPLALREHFLCLWTQSIVHSHGDYEHRVLPDACIDIVFVNQSHPIVVGPWTEPFIARLPAGTTIIGARFRPGRATGLLGLPASVLLNRSVALELVWSKPVNASFGPIAEEPNLVAKRAALETALLRRLPCAAATDRMVEAAIDWLARHPEGRLEQLSQWIGMSGRQLQRRFAAAVGYAPKTFQSVLRFQRLLYLASFTSHRESLAHLSFTAGYADQAHMTREVKRFSGSPPTVLLRSSACTLRMSDFFKTTVDAI